MRKSKLYVALLHYPMLNKRMEIVATSVTNLDLHDISRAARTYDADGFFIVHPAPGQQELIREIQSFWQEGYGGRYNPDRKEAFSLFHLVSNLEEAREFITGETGKKPIIIATDAKRFDNSVSYRQMKDIIFNEEKVFLLLFGTGSGMTPETVESCDYILDPLPGAGNYNHLSVRSAVSIILDRLLGDYWFEG
ncbi:MAG TPA: RNA methyltransferase [Syntrophomonadaceae bacterium]|nr:RNA methyltransferase [Syntrophomonadaceae bacterium]